MTNFQLSILEAWSSLAILNIQGRSSIEISPEKPLAKKKPMKKKMLSDAKKWRDPLLLSSSEWFLIEKNHLSKDQREDVKRAKNGMMELVAHQMEIFQFEQTIRLRIEYFLIDFASKYMGIEYFKIWGFKIII